MPRFNPDTLDGMQTCLADCDADMKVEVEHGVPVDAKTVAQLRSLSTWPPGLVLEVPHRPHYPESVVKVERRS